MASSGSDPPLGEVSEATSSRLTDVTVLIASAKTKPPRNEIQAAKTQTIVRERKINERIRQRIPMPITASRSAAKAGSRGWLNPRPTIPTSAQIVTGTLGCFRERKRTSSERIKAIVAGAGLIL